MRGILWMICATAVAQISGPRLGLVPDGAGLRPLNGIKSAAAIGDAFDFGRNLAKIAVSPRQDYALAVDASSGAVLVLKDAAIPIEGALAWPDEIAISPTGSFAVLRSGLRFQVIGGTAPMRDVDASFLGALRSFAVSDQGAIAAASDAGVFLFAPDGSVAPLPIDDSIRAMVFFSNRSDLALASSTRVLLWSNAFISTLYEHEMNVAGLAVSNDNRHVLVADVTGALYSIGMNGETSIVDCECAPSGVFPITDSLFRLTEGRVRLFDVESNRLTTIVATDAVTDASVVGGISTVPPVTIDAPSSAQPAQQTSVGIHIADTIATDINGTLTLQFRASGGNVDDPMLQFATGGRSVNFTIPAGSTQAQFSGKSNVAISAGTLAGTITLTATVAGDQPPPPTTAAINIAATGPVIDSVTLSQSSGGLTVVVTGYTPTREISSGAFSFSAGANASISQPTITVPLSSAFAQWFGNSASAQFGGEFTLTVPFSVQGNANNVVRVAVNLTNSIGVSGVVSSR